MSPKPSSWAPQVHRLNGLQAAMKSGLPCNHSPKPNQAKPAKIKTKPKQQPTQQPTQPPHSWRLVCFSCFFLFPPFFPSTPSLARVAKASRRIRPRGSRDVSRCLATSSPRSRGQAGDEEGPRPRGPGGRQPLRGPGAQPSCAQRSALRFAPEGLGCSGRATTIRFLRVVVV